SSEAEAASGGDVPFADVIPLTTHDLDLYWSQLLTSYTPVDDVLLVDLRGTLPRCGGRRVTRAQIAGTIFYCIDTNEIISDVDLLHEVYDDSGDFGMAVLIAEEWGVALQH